LGVFPGSLFHHGTAGAWGLRSPTPGGGLGTVWGGGTTQVWGGRGGVEVVIKNCGHETAKLSAKAQK